MIFKRTRDYMTENKTRIDGLIALIGAPIKHSPGTESGIPALRNVYFKFAEDLGETHARGIKDTGESIMAKESTITNVVSERKYDVTLFAQAIVLFHRAHQTEPLEKAIIELLQSKDLAVNSLRLADALAATTLETSGAPATVALAATTPPVPA